MSKRSLSLTSEGRQVVDRALTNKMLSVEDLATLAGLSILTTKRFLARKAIDRLNFVAICRALDLDWSQVTPVENFSSISVHQSTGEMDCSFILTGVFEASQIHLIEQFSQHLRGLLLSSHFVIDKQKCTIKLEGRFLQAKQLLVEASLEQLEEHLTFVHRTNFTSS